MNSSRLFCCKDVNWSADLKAVRTESILVTNFWIVWHALGTTACGDISPSISGKFIFATSFWTSLSGISSAIGADSASVPRLPRPVDVKAKASMDTKGLKKKTHTYWLHGKAGLHPCPNQGIQEHLAHVVHTPDHIQQSPGKYAAWFSLAMGPIRFGRDQFSSLLGVLLLMAKILHHLKFPNVGSIIPTKKNIIMGQWCRIFPSTINHHYLLYIILRRP